MAEGSVSDMPSVSDNGTRTMTNLTPLALHYFDDEDPNTQVEDNSWATYDDDWNNNTSCWVDTDAEPLSTASSISLSMSQSEPISQPIQPNQAFVTILDEKTSLATKRLIC